MVWNNVQQLFSGKDVVCKHKWVSLDNISKNLPLAVVASEDNLFLDHGGFDFDQIKKANASAEPVQLANKQPKMCSYGLDARMSAKDWKYIIHSLSKKSGVKNELWKYTSIR